jgi:hypothetical protein
MSDITRYRADDFLIRVTLRNADGSLLDVDGCTFLLTVSQEEDPTSVAAQLFQSVGVIEAPSTNGVVQFPVVTVDPGRYFFDLEMTDTTGKVKTVYKGSYIVLQDITKGDEEFAITLDSFGVDDTVIALDGNGTEFITNHWDLQGGSTIAQTRDSLRVVRPIPRTGSVSSPDMLLLSGTASRKPAVRPWLEHFEMEALVYLSDGAAMVRLNGVDGSSFIEGGVIHETANGSHVAAVSSITVPGPDDEFTFDESADIVANGADWYRVKMLVDKDYAGVHVKHWIDGEDEPAAWEVDIVPDEQPYVQWAISFYAYPSVAYDGNQIMDVAEISVRTWR